MYSQDALGNKPGNTSPAASSPESDRISNNTVTRKFTLGDALTAVGGLLVFVFSFLPFVTYNDDLTEVLKRSDMATWFNAWAPETFMAPLTWFACLAALSLLALVTIRYFANTPKHILGFSLHQLEMSFSLFSALTLTCYATANKSAVFGSEWAKQASPTYATGVHFGIGGYLMLIFAILALLGAILSYYRVGPILFPQPAAATAAITTSATSTPQLPQMRQALEAKPSPAQEQPHS